MKSWMQFSLFFRYENCVVQKIMVRCQAKFKSVHASNRWQHPEEITRKSNQLWRTTLLFTMLGQVLREAPMGSWSGLGSGASMMVGSCNTHGDRF